MNDVVAVVGEDPLRVVVAFQTVRQLAMLLELGRHLVADGLALLRIGRRAEDEVVGEGSDLPEVKNANRGGFLRFRGAQGNQPRLDLANLGFRALQ